MELFISRIGWLHLTFVAAAQALIYSTRRHLSGTVPLSVATAKFLSNSAGSPNVPDLQEKVKWFARELEAVEYCLDNFESITEPMDKDESFRKLVWMYASADKDKLLYFQQDYQDLKAASINQMIKMSKSTLRWNKI